MPHHASLRNTCLALAGCLALGVAGLTASVPAWGQASGMGGVDLPRFRGVLSI
jgi:hypothetical protein